MSWADDYPTTTYRGPDPYPVPEDWVLNNVEMDGVIWYRYADAENGQEAEHESDIDPDVTYQGPSNVAMLTADPDPNDVDTVTQKFDIDGDPVFTVTDPGGESLWDEVMGCVAEVLARVARGEDYDAVPLPSADEDAGDADLSAFQDQEPL